eukprot:TRINITY_DN6845_c0_g1_i1.p1 TRINITY_DN6845_c0_g1~~TRINITY_DN6845_c0_g1_i1.p1  ORF type:complete len:365 (-),score=67.62 TRINITY_DN6845_c0_g1_i1:19-1113(-)
MAQENGIVGLSLVEKDKNGDVLVTWSFPALDPEVKQVALSCANLSGNDNNSDQEVVVPLQFLWTKYKTSWIHVFTNQNDHANKENPLPRVVSISFILVSTVFNPEKYAALSKIMTEVYQNTGSPVRVLECYLSVFAKGKVDVPNIGSFASSDFDPKKSYLVTPIKEIIKMFGVHVILIWSALLMKKRIVVYSDSLDSLLKIIRALPLFAFHRLDWDILRPYVRLSTLQLKELEDAGVYVAGFTDSDVKMKRDLYDLLVDVNARTVTLSDHAQQSGDFKMGSFHKDLATFMVSSAEAEGVSDQTIIREVSVKTKELLKRLLSLRVKDENGEEYVTLESLQERKLPPGMDRFLFAIAGAEGFTNRK